MTRKMQQALPPDVAVIAYVVGRGGEPTSVFLLTHDTLGGFVTTPVDSLEEPIARLRATLEGNGNARVVAAKLGAALLQAVVGQHARAGAGAGPGARRCPPPDSIRCAAASRRPVRLRAVRHQRGTVRGGRRCPARWRTSRQLRASWPLAVRPTAPRSPAMGSSLPPLPEAGREVAMVARLGKAAHGAPRPAGDHRGVRRGRRVDRTCSCTLRPMPVPTNTGRATVP